MTDLSHLVGTPEDWARAKVEGFEHATLKRLLRGCGCSAKAAAVGEREAGGRLTTSWWHGRFHQWPVLLHVTRIESYSVQDLFERPTRSPVYADFQSSFPGSDVPAALFFKATGFSTLVLTNVRWVQDHAAVYLRFTVRGGQYFVTTFDNFVEAVPEHVRAAVAAESV